MPYDVWSDLDVKLGQALVRPDSELDMNGWVLKYPGINVSLD